MDTPINNINNISLLRLMHLVSPSLPVGSFSYSQGLEWAVEAGWTTDEESLGTWLESVLQNSLRTTDIPLLYHFHQALDQGKNREIGRLTDILLACRETSELRDEEKQRGKAMATLLYNIGILNSENKDMISRSFLGGYAMAATRWKIDFREAALGYLWSWLENQVLSGIKIIPLGQTQGQRILERLIPVLPAVIDRGEKIPVEDIGSSETALSIGSILHETQYTRLYRS